MATYATPSAEQATQDASTLAADRTPRTARGRATLRKLLDAAAIEFGEKGFHEASISSITRRAGTALGSFYTYFESKEALFRALVRDMSAQVGAAAAAGLAKEQGALEQERGALLGFLEFVRGHKEIYRIIDEAEFVDPAIYREHYEHTARRVTARLREAAEAGALRDDVDEFHAWALMGINVFLGMRYGVWDDSMSAESVAARANDLLANGLLPRTK